MSTTGWARSTGRDSVPGGGVIWTPDQRLRVFVSSTLGRPPTIIDVAFETARTVTDMLYKAVFRRYQNIRFVIAHCGGALPALSGRLQLLGLERWVPNPAQITPSELRQHLRRLYLDTAAVAPTGLGPGLNMVGCGHLLFGSDCGRECTTDATMDANLQSILAYGHLSDQEKQSRWRNDACGQARVLGTGLRSLRNHRHG
jgi:6-methylsalicylate decarboxylase